MRAPAFRLRALLPALALALVVSPGYGQQTTPPTAPSTNPFITGPIAPGNRVLTAETKADVLAALEENLTRRAFVPGVDLTKWPEAVAKQQDAIDKADTDAAFARAVNLALRDFGISHIRFLAPRTAQSRVRVSTVGIGIGTRPENGAITVTFVYPESPAAKAGIREGDVITQVDGKVADLSSLQGDDGTEVTLKVRPKDGTEREVKVKRAPYSTVRPDTLTWVGNDAAVLKIHSFSRGYRRDNIDALMGEAAKAKYLVLDLRSNGGGAVSNLNHLLSLLLPEDSVIGTFVSRQSVSRYADAHGGKVEYDPVIVAKETFERYRTHHGNLNPFPGKIAVLVNRGSASASEIAAWALRENLGAPVVGSKSAGAVLASVFRGLPHGYEVQYPIQDYVTKNGVRLEKNPIVPDVEETGRPEGDQDPAVAKAIDRLRTVASR